MSNNEICRAITKNGTNCNRITTPMCMNYCWQHSKRILNDEDDLGEIITNTKNAVVKKIKNLVNTVEETKVKEDDLREIITNTKNTVVKNIKKVVDAIGETEEKEENKKEEKKDDDKFDTSQIPLQEAVSAETLQKKTLPIDKYEYITLEKIDPKFKLARVGVLRDGSCLFHAIVFLIFYNDYMRLDEQLRKEFVEAIKVNFFNKIASSEWILYASDKWEERAVEIMIERINLYLQHKTPNNNGIFGWFSKMDYTNYIVQIINTLMVQNITFSQFKKELPNSIKQNFPSLSVKESDIEIIIGESIEHAFAEYKKSLNTCSQWVGVEEIYMISKEFGLNIFIFEADGSLYLDECSKYALTNPSILLYNQGSDHWEPVVLINEQTQTLELPPNSDLVQDILEKYGC